MYADTITESMQKAMDETSRRREIQMKYNEEHGITPKTIQKSVRDLISISKKVAASEDEDGKRSGVYECKGTGEADRRCDKADEESGSRAEFRSGSRVA